MQRLVMRTSCARHDYFTVMRWPTSGRLRLAPLMGAPLQAVQRATCKVMFSSIASAAQQQQQQQHSVELPASTATAATAEDPGAVEAAGMQQRQHLQLQSLQYPATAISTALQLLAAGNATAAKIEVEVPDFLVENNPVDMVLHSPVFAIGAAVLALILFPKLIRTTINYLFYPAIIALLAYLAISHPEETASSIYYLLEFIKDHPAASSVAVIVAAGVLLGPDVLAGTAVAGVLLLLAAQAGILQLPNPPELPKLPGQQVVARQLGKAGKALQQKVEELDEGKPLLPAAVFSRQQQQRDNDGSSSGSSSGSTKQGKDSYKQDSRDPEDPYKLQTGFAEQAEQMQQQSTLKAAVYDSAAPLQQQERQQQGIDGTLKSLQGFGQKIGSAGKGLIQKTNKALPDSGTLQAGLSSARSGLQSAAEEIGPRVQVLGDKMQQLGLGSKVQELGKGLGSRILGAQGKAGTVAAGALEKFRQGLQKQQLVPVPLLTGAQQQQQQQQDEQQHFEPATAAADSRSVAITGSDAAVATDGSSRIDSILANS